MKFGNVNAVRYQQGQPDQFLHKYTYDADNRITEVETSKDGVLFDKDAKYFYYAHGPLARTELGDNKVQGMDYAYTLQGWIKGINSNLLAAKNDMGRDGDGSFAGNPNKNIARDAFSYSLGYFENDYASIQTIAAADAPFALTPASSDLMSNRNDLFNGNISHMATTITNLGGLSLFNGMAYKYDQLNRIKEAKGFDNLDVATNAWLNSGLPYNGRYENNFTYDPNGNILTQLRKNEAGIAINDMTYNRHTVGGKTLQNRLYHVNDNVASTDFTDDIDDQGIFDNTANTVNTANNYGYDEIGNLVRNNQKEIALMKYTVYGKLKAVIRTPGSAKKNLLYDYDANGNRIAKHVFDSNSNFLFSEFYVRDAQGNVMSIYREEDDAQMQASSFAQIEKHIYGSSRIGIEKTQTEMIGAPPVNNNSFTRTLGNKNYEGVNHLGNVLVTFTDREFPIDADNDGATDYFIPDVVSAADYYPFGVKMKERTFGSEKQRFQFNGKQFDSETETTDFGERNEDGDLGILNAVDKLFAKYPYQSPYAYAGNAPILNQEFGGKDYGVYINHTDKTIIIKATFFTPKGDIDSHNEAVKAVEFWNNQSDKFQYRVENSNGTYTFYNVKFKLSTEELPETKEVSKETETIVEFSTGASKEVVNKTGGQESNLFSVKNDDDVFFEMGTKSKKEAENRAGLTDKEVEIGVKKSQTGTDAGKHEVGHALAAGHIEGTIMAKALNIIKPIINENIIKNILGHAGIRKPFSKNEKITPGTGKVVEETGTAPHDFDKGAVIEK